jgi:hypothetical protein
MQSSFPTFMTLLEVSLMVCVCVCVCFKKVIDSFRDVLQKYQIDSKLDCERTNMKQKGEF